MSDLVSRQRFLDEQARRAEFERKQREAADKFEQTEFQRELNRKVDIERQTAEIKADAIIRQAAEDERMRKIRAANFENSLRESFFASNDWAQESDFQAILPRLKAEIAVENTKTASTLESRMREQNGSF